MRQPRLKGKPVGVTQKYLLVTCNYVARKRGVTKMMGIKEAVAVCPDLQLVRACLCIRSLVQLLRTVYCPTGMFSNP